MYLIERRIENGDQPKTESNHCDIQIGPSGIAAARFAKDCTLTDQAAMVPNIQYNISQNRSVIGQTDDRRVTAQILDWTVDSGEHINSGSNQVDVIIGADVGEAMIAIKRK
jgi:hypothetical protein